MTRYPSGRISSSFSSKESTMSSYPSHSSGHAPLTSPYSWWKVKVRGETQDVDNPVGLVPAAYVEQVSPTPSVHLRTAHSMFSRLTIIQLSKFSMITKLPHLENFQYRKTKFYWCSTRSRIGCWSRVNRKAVKQVSYPETTWKPTPKKRALLPNKLSSLLL